MTCIGVQWAQTAVKPTMSENSMVTSSNLRAGTGWPCHSFCATSPGNMEYSRSTVLLFSSSSAWWVRSNVAWEQTEGHLELYYSEDVAVRKVAAMAAKWKDRRTLLMHKKMFNLIFFSSVWYLCMLVSSFTLHDSVRYHCASKLPKKQLFITLAWRGETDATSRLRGLGQNPPPAKECFKNQLSNRSSQGQQSAFLPTENIHSSDEGFVWIPSLTPKRPGLSSALDLT